MNTTILHCNQCGADWEPRKANPVQCPRCKRVDWREPSKRVRVPSVDADTREASS